jgi:UDP-N-acetyl-D-glucosamine dehydrogenase
VAFAEAGHEVVGLDADPRRSSAQRGRSYVEDVGDAVLDALRERIRGTADHADLEPCDADRDLRPDAADQLARTRPHLPGRRGATLARCCERAARRARVDDLPGDDPRAPAADPRGVGAVAGRDFQLAFSPERIDPGRTDYTVRTTPKLVGGITSRCAERARELYAEICDEVVVLSTPEAAELAKLLENIFRSVNIALVNELAQLCDRLGIDVWEVIDAASTKPFGFMRFDPGPEWAGTASRSTPSTSPSRPGSTTSTPSSSSWPARSTRRNRASASSGSSARLNDAGKPVNGSRILLLGVSYKAGVGDIRESPALKIVALLQRARRRGLLPRPHVPELTKHGLHSADLDEALQSADLVAIITAHPSVDYGTVVARGALVVDFRGVTREIDAANLIRL